ncbi:MAG: hypothetical protein JWL66_1775 [Sphingomonadales bacterium]|nr:hypothetical protein [Sphingomonadales bacterium]
MLCLIMAIGVALRLHGVAFGLPALYDPDEPIFILSALKLLRDHTLNPAWFGHPGTTTIYSLAVIDIGMYFFGHLAGYFADVKEFGQAVYADPGLIILPGRLFMVLCGVICVGLTYVVGRMVANDRVGLFAALLIAVNPLHVQYSQVIRTDVHATVFMLLCVIFSLRIAKTGQVRDCVGAAICVGLAGATKWPALSFLACPVAAIIMHLQYRRWPILRDRRLWIIVVGSLIALIASSPYLLLDYKTVLSNLHGEGRPEHLGATGHGLFNNLIWYIRKPITESFGVLGLVAILIGLISLVWESRAVRTIIAPACLVFLIGLCTQALVWERWIVPLIPFFALAAGAGITRLVSVSSTYLGTKSRIVIETLICIGLATPMVLTAETRSAERTNDTRAIASNWVRKNIPHGRSIVLEHAAIDLLGGQWRFLFPLGAIGCVDVDAALKGKIRYSKVETARAGKSVVDLGNVNPAKIDSCRGDFAIFTNYDRYESDPHHYAVELKIYNDLIKGATPLAEFKPEPGISSGPIVRIFKLRAAPGAT